MKRLAHATALAVGAAALLGALLARPGLRSAESGRDVHPKDDHPFGIPARVPWTTSRLHGTPEPPRRIRGHAG